MDDGSCFKKRKNLTFIIHSNTFVLLYCVPSVAEYTNEQTQSARRKIKTKINTECDKLAEIYFEISYRRESFKYTEPHHSMANVNRK